MSKPVKLAISPVLRTNTDNQYFFKVVSVDKEMLERLRNKLVMEYSR